MSREKELPPIDSQSDLNSLAARLRLAEERYVELRKKLTLIEQNMIANQKKVLSEVKALSSEITDANKRIYEFQDRLLTFVKEVGLLAKKEDVDVLKRYIELWNPVSFVSAQRVEQLINEILEEKSSLK